jgi:hypothetical protein
MHQKLKLKINFVSFSSTLYIFKKNLKIFGKMFCFARKQPVLWEFHILQKITSVGYNNLLTSVFFLAKIGNDPQEYLTKFGSKLNMKGLFFKNILL